MAAEVEEKVNGRRITSGQNPSGEVVYDIWGTDDEAEARAALLLGSDQYITVNGEDGNPVTLTRSGCTPVNVGPDIWDGTVQYAKLPDPDVSKLSINIGSSAAKHITASLSTRRYPATADDGTPQAINQDKTGNVMGLDIPSGPLSFSLHQSLSSDLVTEALVVTLNRMKHTTNNATWRNFAAGEVKFLGCILNERGDNFFDAEFSFEAQPNLDETDADVALIADLIGVETLSIGAWEYVEPVYEDKEFTDPLSDPANKKYIIRYLSSLKIHRVFRSSDFTQLPLDY
jgi:hypothetical protein